MSASCLTRMYENSRPRRIQTASNTQVQNTTLAVNKTGTGTGKITSNPAGIDCGTSCSASYARNTTVTLTAAPDSNSVFSGWSGGCSGTGVCVVTMDSDKSVTASFSDISNPSYVLSVSKTGTGSGKVTSNPAGIDCGTSCSASYVKNDVVVLTATPASGSSFVGWSGACSGTATCSVTMDAAKSVTANFNALTQNAALAVNKTGTGGGKVTSNPAGIDCGTSCSASYARNTTVTLTAAPDSNSTFSGWSGGCSGTGVCVVTMDSDKGVTANFNAVAPVLTTLQVLPPSGDLIILQTSSLKFTLKGLDQNGQDFPLTGKNPAWSIQSVRGSAGIATIDPTGLLTGTSIALGQIKAVAKIDEVIGQSGLIDVYDNFAVGGTAKPSVGTTQTALLINFTPADGTPITEDITVKLSNPNINGGQPVDVKAEYKGNGSLAFGVTGATPQSGVYTAAIVYKGKTYTDTFTIPNLAATITQPNTLKLQAASSTGNVGYSFTNPNSFAVLDVRNSGNGSVQDRANLAGISSFTSTKPYTDGAYTWNAIGTSMNINSTNTLPSQFNVAFNTKTTTQEGIEGEILVSSGGAYGVGNPTVLTVQKVGTGTGIVSSIPPTSTITPSSINCGTACSSQSSAFPPGSTVQLYAIPDSGSIFTGWSGECSGTGTCTVLMNGPKNVTANFSTTSQFTFEATVGAFNCFDPSLIFIFMKIRSNPGAVLPLSDIQIAISAPSGISNSTTYPKERINGSLGRAISLPLATSGFYTITATVNGQPYVVFAPALISIPVFPVVSISVPNPTNNSVSASWTPVATSYNVRITDSANLNSFYSKNTNSSNTTFSGINLPNGQYFMQVNSYYGVDVLLDNPILSRNINFSCHLQSFSINSQTNNPTIERTLTTSSPIVSAAYSPDGSRIVTAGDNTAIIWNASTGAKISTLTGHTDGVSSVGYSPNGSRIVTAGGTTAIIWNASTGAKISTLTGHTDWVNSVAYSPDGSRIITGSDDATAVIWNANTGAKVSQPVSHSSPIRSVAYSPDGSRVVTSVDNTAIVWNASTGAKIATLSGHTNIVRSVVYSPDGSRIITGSDDATAVIWNANTGAKVSQPVSHGSPIRSVAYSPDSSKVVTSVDNTAIIWDASTGAKISTLNGHTANVLSVAYSPDGSRVITGGVGAAIIWNLN
jgi:WD40 repeat protein/uncharacterized protein (DUF2141 family)